MDDRGTRSTTVDDAFNKIQLDEHNKHRAAHGVGALELDAELARQAQEWAEELDKNQKFDHSPADKRSSPE